MTEAQLKRQIRRVLIVDRAALLADCDRVLAPMRAEIREAGGSRDYSLAKAIIAEAYGRASAAFVQTDTIKRYRRQIRQRGNR